MAAKLTVGAGQLFGSTPRGGAVDPGRPDDLNRIAFAPTGRPATSSTVRPADRSFARGSNGDLVGGSRGRPIAAGVPDVLTLDAVGSVWVASTVAVWWCARPRWRPRHRGTRSRVERDSLRVRRDVAAARDHHLAWRRRRGFRARCRRAVCCDDARRRRSGGAVRSATIDPTSRRRVDVMVDQDVTPVGVRSAGWFGGDGLNAVIHRAWLRSQGHASAMFDGRPVIGIAHLGRRRRTAFFATLPARQTACCVPAGSPDFR